MIKFAGLRIGDNRAGIYLDGKEGQREVTPGRQGSQTGPERLRVLLAPWSRM